MKTTRRDLHPPPGLRRDAHPVRWSSSARRATSVSASIASPPSICRTVFVRTHAARRLARGDGSAQSRSRIEEAVNTVEGIDELRSVSGPGVSFVIATFNLDRDIDAAAQDVRDRVVGGRCASCPRDVRPAGHHASPTTTRRRCSRSRCRGEPAAARADRDRRQDRQAAARALAAASARCEIVGGLERAINVWVDADRLAAYSFPITAVRDALVAPERRPARRQRHRRARASRRCARWAASPIRARSTIW